MEVEGVARCPFVHGWLGRRLGGTRSKPNFGTLLVSIFGELTDEKKPLTDELRLEAEDSWKCPDRFSLKLACKAKAESLRDIGVVGFGEN